MRIKLFFLLLLCLSSISVMGQKVNPKQPGEVDMNKNTSTSKRTITKSTEKEDSGVSSAEVTFDCNIEDARLLLYDGSSYKDKGPLNFQQYFEVGEKYTIKVRAKDYNDFDTIIVVNEDVTIPIHLVSNSEKPYNVQKKYNTPSGSASSAASSTSAATKDTSGERVKKLNEENFDVAFVCNVRSAKLYIDGELKGKSAVNSFSLKGGSHEVRVVADGYEDYQRNHTVDARHNRLVIGLKRQNDVPIKRVTVGNVDFNMVYVEGGGFKMGVTQEQEPGDEDYDKTTRYVYLCDYYIAETEVSQELWKKVMGDNPSLFKGDTLPVEKVSWEICKEFINKLNKMTNMRFRFPTEAEWEYAARGGKNSNGYMFSGDNNIESVAWFGDQSNNTTTHHVKSKNPNELGIYNMSGNVLEWCEDWYDSYPNMPQMNPVVSVQPVGITSRVVRGGSFYKGRRECRVAYRDSQTPDKESCHIGLRLVLEK